MAKEVKAELHTSAAVFKHIFHDAKLYHSMHGAYSFPNLSTKLCCARILFHISVLSDLNICLRNSELDYYLNTN